jgi:hypothetical protein
MNWSGSGSSSVIPSRRPRTWLVRSSRDCIGASMRRGGLGGSGWGWKARYPSGPLSASRYSPVRGLDAGLGGSFVRLPRSRQKRLLSRRAGQRSLSNESRVARAPFFKRHAPPASNAMRFELTAIGSIFLGSARTLRRHASIRSAISAWYRHRGCGQSGACWQCRSANLLISRWRRRCGRALQHRRQTRRGPPRAVRGPVRRAGQRRSRGTHPTLPRRTPHVEHDAPQWLCELRAAAPMP